jgi:hypothetical protein
MEINIKDQLVKQALLGQDFEITIFCYNTFFSFAHFHGEKESNQIPNRYPMLEEFNNQARDTKIICRLFGKGRGRNYLKKNNVIASMKKKGFRPANVVELIELTHHCDCGICKDVSIVALGSVYHDDSENEDMVCELYQFIDDDGPVMLGSFSIKEKKLLQKDLKHTVFLGVKIEPNEPEVNKGE